MCGIVGKISFNNNLDLSPEKKINAIDSIRHRGPDSHGQFCDTSVWMGHVRLSILDLSDAGNQPMSTPDGNLIISYNGEAYNFLEIARSLNLQSLRSSSDTEVILEGFAKSGVDIFLKLNGMFAFAIYDVARKKVWLVRDRMGIKPLYYFCGNTYLLFASEIKAMMPLGNANFSCDYSAIPEWLYYGTNLGNRTLFQAVHKLLPGYFMEIDLSTAQIQTTCYWSPTVYSGGIKDVSPTSELILNTRNNLENSVKRQLVSDVPVGVFLSGGIDSSAITAFASRHYGGKLTTYSVGFDFDKGINELPKAREIAQLFNTEHHELRISGFTIADIVEKMVHHHDLPFSDAANIPLYILCSKINATTKVILTGDGGDEIFGGYSRYTTLTYSTAARIFAKFAKIMNLATPRNSQFYRRQRYINALLSDNTAKMLALLLTEEDQKMKPELLFTADMQSHMASQNPFIRYIECHRDLQGEDIVNQMLLMDAMIILPDIFLEKVDRSTMASSVEVRVPFLDNVLVDYCMRLSGHQKVPFGKKKWLLKKALEGIIPDKILYGKKTGFSVPYEYWMRTSLKSFFFDHLQTFQLKNPGILDTTAIYSTFNDLCTNRTNQSFLLWKILNFVVWANQGTVVFPH